MRQLFIALCTSVALLACAGDDNSGTRANIVSGLQANGMDVTCVNSVLDGYTDDQLAAIDKTLGDESSSPQSDALLQQMLACVPTDT